MGRSVKDLTGMVFGKLTVVRLAGTHARDGALWVCLCHCGVEKTYTGKCLTKNIGGTRSCGCGRRRSYPKQDLTGLVSGQLTVIRFAGFRQDQGRNATWLCHCTCGNEIVVTAPRLSNKTTKSCGCRHWMQGEKSRYWRGHEKISGTLWCQLTNGAERRGISVTVTIEDLWELWLRQDGKCALSGKPIELPRRRKFQTASIDRIDSAKGYELGNIQWVHKDVNKMKMDLDQAHFINLCRLIAERN